MQDLRIDHVLETFDGAPIKDMDEEGNSKELTLQRVLVNAVAKPEPNLSGEEATKRFDLSMRIHKSEGTVSVSLEELGLIKKLIPKAYNAPLIIGQAYHLIDPPKLEAVPEQKSETQPEA